MEEKYGFMQSRHQTLLCQEFKTAVLRYIKVFRYPAPGTEQQKPRLGKRWKEAIGMDCFRSGYLHPEL